MDCKVYATVSNCLYGSGMSCGPSPGPCTTGARAGRPLRARLTAARCFPSPPTAQPVTHRFSLYSCGSAGRGAHWRQRLLISRCMPASERTTATCEHVTLAAASGAKHGDDKHWTFCGGQHEEGRRSSCRDGALGKQDGCTGHWASKQDGWVSNNTGQTVRAHTGHEPCAVLCIKRCALPQHCPTAIETLFCF